METETKTRLSDRTIWARGLYMVLFVLIYAVAETVATLLVVFQFIAALVTGKVNDPLLRFGANLSRFIYQVYQFLTFNSETIPFPFTDWPDDDPGRESKWTRYEDDAGVEDAEPQAQVDPRDAFTTDEVEPATDDVPESDEPERPQS